MEIRLKRDDLLAELVPMQGIVERRTTIPVLSHLLLTAKDGRLHVAATDLDVSLVTSTVAQVKSEGALAVQARKLLEIVRALVDDEVRLKDAAAAADVLVMGPDCGTAHVGGVALGFANVVRPGSVGVVAASGTGVDLAEKPLPVMPDELKEFFE